MTSFDPVAAAPLLLRWYDRHRRDLPWRSRPGHQADPYHIWLSEIMLQQTTVAAVRPYYARFLDLFPTVEALAAADREVVLGAWAGLGYYARARNLHACAQAVAAQGGFPRTVAGLLALPGIGAYTANAIGAIAFGLPVLPVDGNVERIASRVLALTDPLPRGRPALHRAALRLGDADAARARPSDFAQALFDLGATLCTPRQPACAVCPWRDGCAGLAEGIAATLPRRAAKTARPARHGVTFCVIDRHGGVLLRRRPDQGLLGGMTELPGTDWRDGAWSAEEALQATGLPKGHTLPPLAAWTHAGSVGHVFSHFSLTLEIFCVRVPTIRVVSNDEHVCPPDRLARAALPSVMRKALALAMGGGAPGHAADDGHTQHRKRRVSA
ncbi:DNA glycosylase A/G-specific MutY [Ameyamaea chiangmaiensis NBRC 103196]|nr:A/G-specific adenine glycosylase [Ameyamaea chiangmaiensis]GBQ63375.1 DNA glycosylase A/G-specific MutY [Ameyamaea chiangmaiensis NBRC 103196]